MPKAKPVAPKPTIVDRLFVLAAIGKGFDGVLETIGGTLLIIIPVAHLHGLARTAIYELSESNHTVLAKYLSTLDSRLTVQLALFAALFLLIHGVIKIALVIALLSRRYRLYPAAIVVLVLFSMYQAYEYGRNPSLGLAVLTLFDLAIVALTTIEWERHRIKPGPTKIKRSKQPLPLTPHQHVWAMLKPYMRLVIGWRDELRLHLAAHPEARRILLFSLAATAFLGGGVALALSLPRATTETVVEGTRAPQTVVNEYTKVSALIGVLENQQSQSGIKLVDDATLQSSLVAIQLDVAAGRYSRAHTAMEQLTGQVNGWTTELGRRIAIATAVPVTTDLFVPIVLYHDTPDNFEQQLVYLVDHGYTAVDMDQVAAAMDGYGSLPPKPIVITFDDGFSDQLQAFALLQKYQMKATFYIIDGGVASRWCIGAGRRYGDPLQPPAGCGDNYLNWDQVRMLDHSGLITIGSHTVDHEDLGSEAPDRQQFEIAEGKAELEKQLGHAVDTFAYPYGSYTQTTIDIVRAAGFTTAVTTLPGNYQSPGSLYTLHRIRDTLSLP